MQRATPAAFTVQSTDWPSINWPLVICGYFVAQVVWRRLLGAGLALDEAEILLWSRHLAWGYGPQPPLYSWLQWIFLQIVPDGLLALSLLKNLLLATTYLMVWRLLRKAFPDRIAGPAALALFLVPQISWDSQRDLTHSVLATALTAAVVLVFWSRVLPGRTAGWALFGVVTGLGLLAKPNFLIVPVALVLAATTMAELRNRISPGGPLLAAAIAALMIALPLRWALEHPEIAFASTHKLELATRFGAAAVVAGLSNVTSALADVLFVTAIVVGAIFVLRRRAGLASAPWTTLERLILRTVIIGIALATAAVLVSGTTNVRSIWLHPVVCLTAPLAAVRLLVATGSAGSRALLRTIAVLAIAVFAGLALNIRYGDPGNPALNRAPIAEIADLIEQRFPAADLIVAEPSWLAGSLIYRRPDLPVVSSTDPGDRQPPDARVLALWWDGDWRERISTSLTKQWDTPVAVSEPDRLSLPFHLQPAEPFDVDAARITR